MPAVIYAKDCMSLMSIWMLQYTILIYDNLTVEPVKASHKILNRQVAVLDKRMSVLTSPLGWPLEVASIVVALSTKPGKKCCTSRDCETN